MKGRLVYSGSTANNTSYVSYVICNDSNLDSYVFTPLSSYTDMTSFIISRHSVFILHTNIRADKTVSYVELEKIYTKNYDLSVEKAEDEKSFILSWLQPWDSAIIFGRGLDGYTVVKQISQ